ncbi:Polyketide biosynthesis cytochrome P450 PksS [bacterium HR29]|mgnify:CR=1 FL=1|jgi:cytochrome P450|nr:Polyketide biosynthesis cytochrome P450 PksS [bacterium HR29]
MRLPNWLERTIERTAYRGLLLWERLESGVAFDLLDRQYRTNPYPLYRRLRERDPIHRSRVADAWVFSRYADVSTILRDPSHSADDRNRRRYEQERRRLERRGLVDPDQRPSFLRLDPPDHTRLRGLVAKAFTPRRVQELRPRIEAIVDGLLTELEAKGSVDLIHDFAVPLPVTVIAELLGIPPEDRARFRKWSDDLAGSLDANRPEILIRARQSRQELRAYLEPIVEDRRRAPRDDLISALVQAEEAGDRLTRDEVFSTIILLLVAGNETTTNLIGNGLLALLRNPDQLERFRREPELTENAVEELLRYDSPVQATSRIALRDFEFQGRLIRKGQGMVLLLGAANRDPAVFPDPDRLDIGRSEIRHFSFGQGIHYCLGAPLARLEGQIALRRLADTFDRIELAGEPEWGENFILHGLKRLPLRVGRTSRVAVGARG